LTTDPRASSQATERNNTSFWNALEAFFFRPSGPQTLAVIRIWTGLMIAYIHLIWMMDLEAFMGPNALIDNSTWRSLHQNLVADNKWTYLAATESMTLIWLHEMLAFAAGLLLAVGFMSRGTCVLAWFLTLMTAHRMTGFLFGLDQVTIMLAMYLCFARSGSLWSLDAWFVQKYSEFFSGRKWLHYGMGILAGPGSADSLCWTNTFATRLIQLHLCVIYLFGGLGKMRGEMWWDGTAMWYSVASYEYQSLPMTWTGNFPFLASIATHITVFWELSYCCLVWPRWTRPWVLGIALLVHGGIALFLGMITFGWMMIVANLAFVPPDTIRKLVLRNK